MHTFTACRAPLSCRSSYKLLFWLVIPLVRAQATSLMWLRQFISAFGGWWGGRNGGGRWVVREPQRALRARRRRRTCERRRRARSLRAVADGHLLRLLLRGLLRRRILSRGLRLWRHWERRLWWRQQRLLRLRTRQPHRGFGSRCPAPETKDATRTEGLCFRHQHICVSLSSAFSCDRAPPPPSHWRGAPRSRSGVNGRKAA